MNEYVFLRKKITDEVVISVFYMAVMEFRNNRHNHNTRKQSRSMMKHVKTCIIKR
jgi:hypothetical protein